MDSLFFISEKFDVYDDDYRPYNVKIQSSSNLWHKHALCTPNGYCVVCTGNRYFIDTPQTLDFEACFDFFFGHLTGSCGVSIYFGYDTDGFTGYELRVQWRQEENDLTLSLFELSCDREDLLCEKVISQVSFPAFFQNHSVNMTQSGGQLSVTIDSLYRSDFEIAPKKGFVGFSRPHFIGSLTFTRASVGVDCPVQALCAPVKVEIPLVNGGTTPLTVEYSLFEADGNKYLKATLDGGPQYRTQESYHPYPCNKKGQYMVETWYMDRPYFTYNEKKFYLKKGEVNLADPGLAWKDLQFKLMPYTLLPLSLTVSVDGEGEGTFGFGYEELYVNGYNNQRGKAEFMFAPSGDYLGQKTFEDTFELRSPKDKKAVQRIPETVFDLPAVKEHFENNHYFAEGEKIRFHIHTNTQKSYITYKAELQDAFGDLMEEIPVQGLAITYKSLPVGVYRLLLRVFYGGELFKTVDTVFEVFDEAGEKCAPTESGLPFQFSMPNEQQYLDHDGFDPWAKKPSCNSEHYYPCTAFTGHVAEYKRTWEVTELFGRKWYVWFSDHRTMVDHSWDKHPDIVKHADFMYYPSEYEWAVLRSDFGVASFWKRMPKLREVLDRFLDRIPGSAQRIGLEKGQPVTDSVIIALHRYYQAQWYAYAHNAIKDMFHSQNEMFSRDNPKLKRACYGPFNLYAAPMRTSKLSEMYGFEGGDTLSDVIYTGFAQLEDYPNFCAYQTYNGAFAVGATLVNSPRLTIYPEQYGSSRGGCIDGAVYFAHPPIGASEMPRWFSTTHAREFVFNTPRKTQVGFSYWNTYGFMKWDFSEEENDAFIRDWKYVVKHSPERPLKSTAYVCSFDKSDDRFEGDQPNPYRFTYNVSEEGVGYLYETSRLCGLPASFFTDWQNLMTLSEKDTDAIVLTSTKGLGEDALEKIRDLHQRGVALIGVSCIDGLEDLFGVCKSKTEKSFSELTTPTGERESVYPMKDTFSYCSIGAQCVLYASDTPAIYTYGNTVLFNVSPLSLGRTWFFKQVVNARSSNSRLLRKTVAECIKRVSSPLAWTDDCGITLFNTKSGDTMLLCIDYSRHDDSEMYLEKERTIWFTEGRFQDAQSVEGKPMRKLVSQNGSLDGIAVTLRQHESALIRLF